MMIINENGDHSSISPSPTHQLASISINEDSRKRKERSPNYPNQESDDSPPQNPKKVLRLFGVDMIYHFRLFGVYMYIHQDNPQPIIPQNTNQEEAAILAPIEQQQQQAEAEPEAIPAPIQQQQQQQRGFNNRPLKLFEKVLTSTDVARNHNRLLITGYRRLMRALTEDERRIVELNGNPNFLAIETRDGIGGKYTMHLTKWLASGAIVLIHHWWKFVDANGLQEGDSVEGWGYRSARGEFRLNMRIEFRNQG